MKTLRLALLAAPLALLSAGCGPAGKKISDRDLNEARALYSEAQFAMNVKDWARAEPLLVRAAKITPEPEFFQNLGAVRMRLNNRAGAKAAYESALDVCARLAATGQAGADARLKQVRLLALLGKTDEARALLARIEQELPRDPAVRAFVDGRALDALIAAPIFKEIAL